MNNPLVNVFTPKVRAWVYAVAFLASLAYGAFTAADGDWHKAIPSFLGSVIALTAASNASPTPEKPGRHALGEGGYITRLFAMVVLIAVGMAFAVFAWFSPAQAHHDHALKDTNWPCAGCVKGQGGQIDVLAVQLILQIATLIGVVLLLFRVKFG